jgi:hypothetical protein
MKGIALLLLGLSAGCGTTSYGSGAVGAHPPPLPRGASVPKWDHFCSIVGAAGEISRYLDEASENGWELVSWSISGNGNLACFKRPRVTVAAPENTPPAPPTAGTPPASR